MFKKIEKSTYLYHLSDFSEPRMLSNKLQTPLRVNKKRFSVLCTKGDKLWLV